MNGQLEHRTVVLLLSISRFSLHVTLLRFIYHFREWLMTVTYLPICHHTASRHLHESLDL